MIDYEAYLKALKKVGYDGYWVFEVSGAAIVDSKKAWNDLMARYWQPAVGPSPDGL